MKILVIKRTPPKRFLIELHSDKIVGEVAILVAKKRYSEAIRQVLTKGRFEKEVIDDEKIRADIVLMEE